VRDIDEVPVVVGRHQRLDHCEAAVTFPLSTLGLSRATWRNLPTQVLMKLSNQTLWRVRGTGILWSPQQLAALAAALLASAHRPTNQPLDDYLTEALELPLHVARPSMSDLTIEGWNVRRLALALCMAKAFDGRPPASIEVKSSDVSQVEAAIGAQLASALEAFVDAMDAGASRIASSYRQADQSAVYAYLVDDDYAARRRDLARVLPIMLLPLATAQTNAKWSKLRSTVDRARPLVEDIARQFGISRAAARFFVGVPIELIEERWRTAPAVQGLFEMLDDLRAEARPKDEAGWRRLQWLLDVAEQEFGQGHVARAWCREILHGKSLAAALRPKASQACAQAAPAVQALRDALLASVRADLQLPSRLNEDAVATSVRRHTDRWLMRTFPLKALCKLSATWLQELARLRRESEPMTQFAHGKRYWPIWPGEYRSSDGYAVQCITDARWMSRHGAENNLCLAGGQQFSAYDSACRAGTAAIVVVRDVTGRAMSTAGLRIRAAQAQIDRVDISVVEHRGPGNAVPSAGCAGAVHEFVVALNAPAAQQHLRLGASIRNAMRRGLTAAMDQVEARTRTLGLEAALGARHDELLNLVREAVATARCAGVAPSHGRTATTAGPASAMRRTPG